MRCRCLCLCHAPPDGLWNAMGVDTSDVLEAAVACPECQSLHCNALLTRPLSASERHELTPWVDPPRRVDPDPDGDEWQR